MSAPTLSTASAAAAVDVVMPHLSLAVAYLLWLLAPPLGLHHLYLGRDTQGMAHAATFGGFGFAWLYDGFAMPHYVHVACGGEAPAHPFFSAPRWVGTIAMSAILGLAVPSAIAAPPDVGYAIADVPPDVLAWVGSVLCPIFATLGAWLVSSAPPLHTSFLSGVLSSTAGLLLAVPLDLLLNLNERLPGWLRTLCGAVRAVPCTLSVIGASLGVHRRALICPCLQRGRLAGVSLSLVWRLPRMLLVGSAGWLCYVLAYYMWGSYWSYEQVRWVPAAHAVHSLMDDAEVRAHAHSLVTEALGTLRESIPHHGLWRAAVRAWHTFDPTGEGRACESLGVAQGASLAEIKKAYRQMALAFHPDKATDEAERELHELRFREVQMAYESLQRLRKEQGRPADGEAGEIDHAYSHSWVNGFPPVS